jgi:hypothetical protein
LPSASAPHTRQRRCLCRVSTRALGTGTGGGAHWTNLCRGPHTRQNWPLCRVPQNALGKGSVTVTWRRDGDFSLPSVKWHSAKSLPSAQQKVLGKEAVADVQFAERSLPSVTLGKGFAECTIAFTVCLRHTAKALILVVFWLRAIGKFFCGRMFGIISCPSMCFPVYFPSPKRTAHWMNSL